MKALITGANGFVAAYLSAELASHGYEVLLSDPAAQPKLNLPYFQAELSDPRQVEKLFECTQPDAVFHLAGIADVRADSQDQRASLMALVNVGATHYICDALVRQKRPATFVLISSGLVYRPNTRADFAGYIEDSEIGPVNDYGWSKLAAESLARIYDQTSIQCYIVRPFNHIGPGQDARFVCPALAKRIYEAKENDIIPVGNMHAERDFTDVRDIVRAYRLIMEKRPTERLFVLGSGRPTPIKRILDFFLEYSGKHLSFETSSALLRTEHDRVFCDASRAREILGWTPTIRFEQTLADIYDSIHSSSSKA